MNVNQRIDDVQQQLETKIDDLDRKIELKMDRNQKIIIDKLENLMHLTNCSRRISNSPCSCTIS